MTGLEKILKTYLSPDDIAKIMQAYECAHAAHQGQTRHTGDPYITHPIAVARILAEMHLDAETISAAILHDVLEDTPIEKAKLSKQFGKEVAELVDGVSKLTQITFETRAHAQAENFRKMVMAMAKDIRVIIIKLADRLHNMRTIQAVPDEKRKRVAKETLEIYAPIANRLGMHAFRIEYEELGFQAVYPMRYGVLKKAISNAKGNRRGIIKEIETNLQKCIKQSNIGSFELISREKHLYSIFKKMRDKHLSFSEIMDIYGFRVVVDSLDQCYRVMGALHNLYKPLPNRFKDYIAIPKANGYQSLHTTLFGPYGVPIEIQIRTRGMEHMAESGIAAHWLYKSDEKVCNAAHHRAREWIKGVLEMQKSAGSSIEFIENVKIDLFPHEVYVFTPRGTILELPNGATPVDFAYAIHSDIGNTCVASKIDRKLTPLSTQLSSGQTVEVITAPNARPNPAWLNFVVSGKARSNIRHFLKSQRKKESIKLGKRLLQKAIQTLMPSVKKLSKDMVRAIVSSLNLNTIDELYEDIGLGNRMAMVVARQVHQLIAPDEEKDALAISVISQPLAIHGTEGLILHYAKCCRPIPGDTIVGYFVPGKGLIVHHTQCSDMAKARVRKPSDCIPLQWEEDMQGEYDVDVRVDALNQRGLLARLATALNELDTNISHIRAEEHDNIHCYVNMTIGVEDRLHLARIFKRLRRVESVLKVQRKIK